MDPNTMLHKSKNSGLFVAAEFIEREEISINHTWFNQQSA